MSRLLRQLRTKPSDYVDRSFLRNGGTKDEYHALIAKSTTLYIGNLSFYTTEDQIYSIFSRIGDIRRIIMGLHRDNLTPCGFCFVLYYTREDTEAAIKYLNGTTLDGRIIRVDVDYGFVEGRQYGRGKTGGQVRDEVRLDYDADRGGYGKRLPRGASRRITSLRILPYITLTYADRYGCMILTGRTNTTMCYLQIRVTSGRTVAAVAVAEDTTAVGEDGREGVEAIEEATEEAIVEAREVEMMIGMMGPTSGGVTLTSLSPCLRILYSIVHVIPHNIDGTLDLHNLVTC